MNDKLFTRAVCIDIRIRTITKSYITKILEGSGLIAIT